MATVLSVVLILFGAILVFAGLWAFYRGKTQHHSGGGSISLLKVFSVSTPNASLLVVGMGVLMIAFACWFHLGLMEATDTVEDKRAQLEEARRNLENLQKEMASEQRQILQETFEAIEVIEAKLPLTTGDDAPSGEFATGGRDLALFFLRSLGRNSFDLVEISSHYQTTLIDFLARVDERFGDDIEIQVELAKLYRSLYNSDDLKVSIDHIQDCWNRSVAKLNRLESGQHAFTVDLITAVNQTARGNYAEALAALDRAAGEAGQQPELLREMYKVHFNRSNIYIHQQRWPQAVEAARKAGKAASQINLPFWQAKFNEGLGLLGMEQADAAAAAFLDGMRAARNAGEADLLNHWLSAHEDELSLLCQVPNFYTASPSLCQGSDPGPEHDTLTS